MMSTHFWSGKVVLYLAEAWTVKAYPKLYSVWVKDYVISAPLGIYATEQDISYRCCIVDIDEIDACSLILQGIQLFRVVEMVECAYQGQFTHTAVMANLSAVAEWWGAL